MPGLVHYLFISCTGLSSLPSIKCDVASSFVLGLLPRLPVLCYWWIFLFLSFNFFTFCWPPDSTLSSSETFYPFSFILPSLNLVLCIYKNAFSFVVFGKYHLAFEFCSCIIKRSSDMAPFLFLLLCMDHTPVNTGNSFLGVCSSVRNPAAVAKALSFSWEGSEFYRVF